MIEKLKEKVLKIVTEIEAAYPEYQDRREGIMSDQDLVSAAKRRQDFELFEATKNKIEDLHKQGQTEIEECRDLIIRQIKLAKKSADNAKGDLAHRTQVESVIEELESELIAVGGSEFLRGIVSLLKEEDGSVIRLEAARAVLPSLKYALYEELHTRLNGKGVYNPWETEKESKNAISPENQALVKEELRDVAKRLSDALKPEKVKEHEYELVAVNELESEIDSASSFTSRLLSNIKPAELEGWTEKVNQIESDGKVQ